MKVGPDQRSDATIYVHLELLNIKMNGRQRWVLPYIINSNKKSALNRIYTIH